VMQWDDFVTNPLGNTTAGTCPSETDPVIWTRHSSVTLRSCLIDAINVSCAASDGVLLKQDRQGPWGLPPRTRRVHRVCSNADIPASDAFRPVQD